MIDRLRKRMIWICCASVVAVFILIFAAIALLGTRQLDRNMDMMADRISEGDGRFRAFDRNEPRPPEMDRNPGFFTEETPFSTRSFTVWLEEDGSAGKIDLRFISSVTEEGAREYAEQAQSRGTDRGWLGNYRYKVFSSPRGRGIVFVDGSMNRATTRTMLLTVAAVLLGCLLVIAGVIVVVSRRAVRPIARSYEKQKQFVTDANHELKTPLTLILTNLDIVEQELGHSEWLDDIRAEGQRMSGLVGQLTALSRLDEDVPSAASEEFSLSEVCGDTVSEFSPLIDRKGLTLRADIQPEITLSGDEGAVRRLVTILLDNAVKYCDPGGDISLSLTAKRRAVLVVENTCSNVDALELDRLFDRFYRADKARTAGGSFGIGLSLAQSVVRRHRGEIRAYKAGPGRIGFRVTMK